MDLGAFKTTTRFLPPHRTSCPLRFLIRNPSPHKRLSSRRATSGSPVSPLYGSAHLSRALPRAWSERQRDRSGGAGWPSEREGSPSRRRTARGLGPENPGPASESSADGGGTVHSAHRARRTRKWRGTGAAPPPDAGARYREVEETPRYFRA